MGGFPDRVRRHHWNPQGKTDPGELARGDEMRLFVFLALCTATILTMVQSCVTDVPMDELVQRLDESQTFAFQAAVSNLFLPLGWIIGWLAVLAVLFAVVAALSARPPSQRVIGLVAERLLRFAGAILAVALLSQVGVFVCRYFLERTVLTPDPRWGHFVFDPFLELFIAGYIALLFCQASTERGLDETSSIGCRTTQTSAAMCFSCRTCMAFSPTAARSRAGCPMFKCTHS
jgi:hypothetical protein